jgi:hypothetical protein
MDGQLRLVIIFLLISCSINAQHNIKIKKEDNRFLFFQIGLKNDTIIKNKTDLFLIKFPDSLKTVLRMDIENAKFTKSKNANTYQLSYILGMKYSHIIKDTIIETLVEGVSQNSKIITISIKNIKTSKVLMSNKFIVK